MRPCPPVRLACGCDSAYRSTIIQVANDDEAARAPSQVAELAQACVRFVAARYGTTLDFAPETLSFVDQWVRDARAEARGKPELVELVQAAAGAYLGEVVRRAFGGCWVTDGSHADWRVLLCSVYCSVNPIGMAREALLLERADGWHAHLELDPAEAEAFERRLAALPPVAEDEFFAPTTRFDVLSMLVEGLRSTIAARGLGQVRFTPDDYN
jgi:hypothetical protein